MTSLLDPSPPPCHRDATDQAQASERRAGVRSADDEVTSSWAREQRSATMHANSFVADPHHALPSKRRRTAARRGDTAQPGGQRAGGTELARHVWRTSRKTLYPRGVGILRKDGQSVGRTPRRPRHAHCCGIWVPRPRRSAPHGKRALRAGSGHADCSQSDSKSTRTRCRPRYLTGSREWSRSTRWTSSARGTVDVTGLGLGTVVVGYDGSPPSERATTLLPLVAR
jgi:hypothetical protein